MDSTAAASHWDQVYGTNAPDAVSWYRPHLETSLALIERAARDLGAAIIDVGGGESTLIDDLLERGYGRLTVIDISRKALEVTQARVGPSDVEWIAADVTQVQLPQHAFDVWHDRAVFHFLTDAADRQAYVERVAHAVRPGGHVIVSTFGAEGPQRCSGLPVVRYDDQALHGEFGTRFRLLESRQELHYTPWGAPQNFVYCYCRVG